MKIKMIKKNTENLEDKLGQTKKVLFEEHLKNYSGPIDLKKLDEELSTEFRELKRKSYKNLNINLKDY